MASEALESLGILMALRAPEQQLQGRCLSLRMAPVAQLNSLTTCSPNRHQQAQKEKVRRISSSLGRFIRTRFAGSYRRPPNTRRRQSIAQSLPLAINQYFCTGNRITRSRGSTIYGIHYTCNSPKQRQATASTNISCPNSERTQRSILGSIASERRQTGSF